MKYIYDNIEEINEYYGVSLEIPKNIPDGCNMIMYKIYELYNIEPIGFYKVSETNAKVEVYDDSRESGGWITSMSNSVDLLLGLSYGIILLKLKPTCEKFTLEKIIGCEVLTKCNKKVYITNNVEHPKLPYHCNYVHTTDTLHLFILENLRFYVSDDSDETVSFTEYVEMFYGEVQ